MSGKYGRSTSALVVAVDNKRVGLVKLHPLTHLPRADSFRFVPRFEYQNELEISLENASRAEGRSL